MDKKKIIREKYGKIADDSNGCGCSNNCCDEKQSDSISKRIGYSQEEIQKAKEADLGLGCGNPIALGSIEEGETVVDLGSGAGLDCFLAAEKVGESGRVIGIDMTKEMIEKARRNKKKREVDNIEFILAEIEDIPLEDRSVDKVISNCVINLSPDKDQVFKEVYRILKDNGEMYLSDIVLLEELSEEQRNDEELFAGCVAGAILKEDYLQKIKDQDFEVEILSEDREISKEQYNGIALESITLKISRQ